MATWNSRGLRGSTLEDMVNITIEQYRQKKLALIQKIPTPIKPIHIDKASRHITLAYFDQKSTVDYLGAVQGIPVCFDAKECQNTTFPLANVHAHQMEFMKDMECQGGVSFFLIYFTKDNQVYYIPYRTMNYFWKRQENGGKKSIALEELKQAEAYQVMLTNMTYLHFLEALQKDLSCREMGIDE